MDFAGSELITSQAEALVPLASSLEVEELRKHDKATMKFLIEQNVPVIWIELTRDLLDRLGILALSAREPYRRKAISLSLQIPDPHQIRRIARRLRAFCTLETRTISGRQAEISKI
jgi:hypothetical protein